MTGGQTDGRTTDKVIPMCRYASQATQKRFNDSFQFIFHTLKDNKLKMFRWKLAHNLVNTENLYKWKIATSPLCKIFKRTGNYSHFFIDCNLVSNFCRQMNQTLHSLGFKECMITLENITSAIKYMIQNSMK